MDGLMAPLPAATGGRRFVLGTAQLGMGYGIANRAGKPDRAAADRLLKRAWDAGVRLLDTAAAYGDSEQVIGDWLRRNPACGFGVIGKLDGRLNDAPAATVHQAVEASVAALGRPMAALLLHDDAGLDRWDAGLGAGLRYCVEAGLAERLGVSVYAPDRFAAALANADMVVIQAPFNVLDRRLATQGLLSRAAAAGRTVMLRSALLQGLLTLTPETLPDTMGFAGPALAGWRSVCAGHALAPGEAALRYVVTAAAGSYMVIGCETDAQVATNAAVLAAGPLDATMMAAIEALPQGEDRLVNPALWP